MCLCQVSRGAARRKRGKLVAGKVRPSEQVGDHRLAQGRHDLAPAAEVSSYLANGTAPDQPTETQHGQGVERLQGQRALVVLHGGRDGLFEARRWQLLAGAMPPSHVDQDGYLPFTSSRVCDRTGMGSFDEPMRSRRSRSRLRSAHGQAPALRAGPDPNRGSRSACRPGPAEHQARTESHGKQRAGTLPWSFPDGQRRTGRGARSACSSARSGPPTLFPSVAAGGHRSGPSRQVIGAGDGPVAQLP